MRNKKTKSDYHKKGKELIEKLLNEKLNETKK